MMLWQSWFWKNGWEEDDEKIEYSLHGGEYVCTYDDQSDHKNKRWMQNLMMV